MTGPVHQLDAGHPFVNGDLVLAREVVDMADQAGHELAEPRVGLGAHSVDDIVGEIGVKSVGSHVDSFFFFFFLIFSFLVRVGVISDILEFFVYLQCLVELNRGILQDEG